MTPAPDLTPLLPNDATRQARREALVAELESGTAAGATDPVRRTNRRTLLRTGIALSALAAVTLAATTVIPGPGGSSIDVVSAARAATTPGDGQILHFVVRYEAGPYESMGVEWSGPLGSPGAHLIGRLTGRTERWIARDPLRERSVEFYDSGKGKPQPTRETAYADGIVRTARSWSDEISAQRLRPAGRRDFERSRLLAARPTLRGLDFSADPVAVSRALLDSGRLRDAGRAELRGRAVAKLVGREPGYRDSGGSWSPSVAYEYFVDAKTFAPVQVTSTRILAARPGDPEPAARHERRIVSRWIFDRFEHLPLDASTAPLLKIDEQGRKLLPVRLAPTPRQVQAAGRRAMRATPTAPN